MAWAPARVRERLAAQGARRVAALVGAAVLIRLLVMPFTLHFDAYQIYSRAHEAAYHNQWFGFTSQFLVQGLHNVWLLLIRPLLPHSEAIWSHSASTIGVGASQDDYARFLAYDHLYRAIFLMKLPYVAADLGCAYVLAQLVAPARRFAVAAFWLLNPLVIFSSAIYGRHDSVAILVMLLGLAAARRATDRYRLLGIGLLGVATLMRFFPIIIVAPFLLAFRRSARQLALFAGLLFGMAALVELAGIATSGKSTILTVLESYEHFKYWFDAGLYLRFDDYVLLFPVAYALGLLWLSERGMRPEEFPTVAAVAFLLLFSLTFFHPHYAIWLVPFLALTIADRPRLLVYHAIQVVCVLVYAAQWGSWTTWDLLRPLLGERVASLPDPVEAIQAQIEPRIFFGLFRSLLTAVSLWTGWRLLRDLSPRPSLSGATSPPGPLSNAEGGSEGRQDEPTSSTISSPSLARRGGRGVRFVLLLPLVTSACSARVSGYASPLAHDYGPLSWQPLTAVVEQSFVAGPGYSAAVNNDPHTTPSQLQQRLAALPADARTGTLRELRVGARLRDGDDTAWATGARAQLAYAPELDLRFPERDFHAWGEDEEWLPELAGDAVVEQSFVSPYPSLAGVVIRIATFSGDLSPGEGVVGRRDTRVLSLPIDGEPLGMLAGGTRVAVLGATEGWARVRLPDEREGFAPLDAFVSLPAPARRVAAALHAELLDAGGAVVRTATIPPADLHDNAHLAIRFPALPHSANASYRLRLSLPDASPGSGITIRLNPSDVYLTGAALDAAGQAIGDLVFRPLYDPSHPVLDMSLDALPRDGDWLRVPRPPDVPAGAVLLLRLMPGDGRDASQLEYGLTTDRAPYGGWTARAEGGASLSGALLVQTRYERDVAGRAIVGAGLRHLRAAAGDDSPFTLVYLGTLAFFAIATLRVWRGLPRRRET
jgi:hypothetical protein